MKFIRLATLAALALAAVAPAHALDDVKVITSTGTHHFQVEIAADDASREKGLMFRKYLPADRGMLFEFDKEATQTFWMKNTPLSLDLVFIDGHGKVVTIAANAEPESEDIIASSAPSKAVLELNAGAAAAIGLKDGDRVEFPFFAK